MIADSQTNFLYLADSLPEKYPIFYKRFEQLLKECNINFELLPGTKDVRAVDYMPVQTSINRCVQFTYSPDYLKPAKWSKTISDTDAICKAIGIQPVKSDLIVDGGNVIRSKDSVIMCDKVFRENVSINERKLIVQLKDLFEVDKLFFVPQDKHDFTGHADGMVRVIDDHTVLINDYSKEDIAFQLAFRMALHNTGLQYIEITYCPDPYSLDSAKCAYVNYLQMEGGTEILRKTVKKQIDTADEKSLKIIQAVLDVREEHDWWDDLSDAARYSIEQGLKEADEGKLTPHKEVMKKYKKWM